MNLDGSKATPIGDIYVNILNWTLDIYLTYERQIIETINRI